MALDQWDEGDDNGCMSETVILALITAAAAIFTAGIGAYDRRTLYREKVADELVVADQLLTHRSPAV